MSTERVLALVRAERLRQDERYGDVNDELENGTGPETRWLLPYTSDPAALIEAELRKDYEDFEGETGLPTWCHLIREEVAEVFQEEDPFLLAEELIQVAALAVSWVEQLQKKHENWKWGVVSTSGDMVYDSDWKCAADVMASTHGFGGGPYQVVVKRPGDDEWRDFWVPANV